MLQLTIRKKKKIILTLPTATFFFFAESRVMLLPLFFLLFYSFFNLNQIDTHTRAPHPLKRYPSFRELVSRNQVPPAAFYYRNTGVQGGVALLREGGRGTRGRGRGKRQLEGRTRRSARERGRGRARGRGRVWRRYKGRGTET